MRRKITTLTLGLAAAGLISAPFAAAAPGDNASANGNGKSVSENVKAGGAAAQKAAERAAKAADQTRASVGKAVSEAAKGGGGSVAVLTVLKPDNLGVCVALGLAPVVNVGPITVGPIEVGFPGAEVLSLNICGPGKGVAVDTAGTLGPIVISLANQIVQKFPYTYLGNAAVDIPFSGSETVGPFSISSAP